MKQHKMMPKERQQMTKRLEHLYGELREEATKNSSARQRLEGNLKHIDDEVHRQGG